MRGSWIKHLSLALFVLTTGRNSMGQDAPCDVHEAERFIPFGTIGTDDFGDAISVSGPFAFVGSPDDDDVGVDVGSVFVYRKSGGVWIPDGQIYPSDPASAHNFGRAAFAHGNVLAIGSFDRCGDENFAGGVYLFEYDGANWVQQAKMCNPDPKHHDFFGAAVALTEGLLIVGAWGDDDSCPGSGFDCGAAYIFEREDGEWTQIAKLIGTELASGDRFGSSVAINGDTAVVAARRADGVCEGDNDCDDMGAVYVFRQIGESWVEEARLTASDADQHDQFGSALGLAPDHLSFATSGGDKVYVFQYDGKIWNETAILLSPGGGSDHFGTSLAIQSDLVLIGAPFSDENGYQFGTAYLFERKRDEWTPVSTLSASAGQQEEQFGQTLTMDDGVAWIGTGALEGAAAYVFQGIGDCDDDEAIDACQVANGTAEDCNTNGIPDTCDIVDGSSADIDQNGIPDDCDCDDGLECTIDTLDGSGKCMYDGDQKEGIACQGGQGVCNLGVCVVCTALPEIQKMTAADAEESDWFGFSMAVDAARAIIGAPKKDEVSANFGAAYTFTRIGNEWVQEAKLAASDAAAFDEFGWSVAINGDVVAVGSKQESEAAPFAGAAYVFRHDGNSWIQEQKLIASDAAASELFGTSIAVDRSVIVVGAVGITHSNDTGSAYVFRYDGNGWAEEAKLPGYGQDGEEGFAASVAVAGGTILVGVPSKLHDHEGFLEGAVIEYEYVDDNWVETAVLVADEGQMGDRFGNAIALVGDRVLIGDPGHDGFGHDNGAAYVFERIDGVWNQAAQLMPNNGAIFAEFGASVALYGDLAIIGSPEDIDRGSAFVFRFDGSEWSQQGKIRTSDANQPYGLGTSVAAGPDWALIGAPRDTDLMGAVYYYEGLSDCNGNGLLDACDIASGLELDVDGDFVPDSCEGLISIIASAPPNGAIDARQPSEPDGSNPAGWSAIQLEFSGDARRLAVGDFVVDTDPSVPGPVVTDVTVDGSTVSVSFDGFVPVGAWTIITHVESDTGVRIGYLPGDVNNDRVSSSNDVLTLIDALNGAVGPLPEYQVDIDRSLQSNANDILRIIDLLNGAGVYEEYLGTTLPD